MSIKDAQLLRKGDVVEWLWLPPGTKDREFGTVTGCNDRCFSVEWMDEFSSESVFFFDTPHRIENMIPATPDRVYKPEDLIA